MTITALVPEQNNLARFRRVHIVCNTKAGGVRAGDRELLIEKLRASGADRVEPLRFPLRRREMRGLNGEDLVVVLGGDGTARSVAAACARANGPTLIILPGGTLNMLPYALYGELPWAEALDAALTRGEERELVGACANGRPFFVAATFGSPALLARAREAVRRGQLLAALRRLRHFYVRAFSRRLAVREAQSGAGRVEAVAVLCPAFPGALQSAGLEWARFAGRQMDDLARLGVKALLGAWRDDPAVNVAAGGAGDIASRWAIPATLDGEPKLFHRRVRIEPLKHGPKVLAAPTQGS